ncbi:TraM recognition domain-containing protein [Albirhodobacter sp. R86504]|uniref:TraM recognition domain-containing protein n=1 Tax=Albirhodobacter sp. R86504 TaxID=3093848 RepID=UPI00366EC6C5
MQTCQSSIISRNFAKQFPGQSCVRLQFHNHRSICNCPATHPVQPRHGSNDGLDGALFVVQDTDRVGKACGSNDARSIFGSCITKRAFNLNDIETAEWAARHLGKSTAYSQQIREGKLSNEGRDFFTRSSVRGSLTAEQDLYFKTKAYRGRFDQNSVNRAGFKSYPQF